MDYEKYRFDDFIQDESFQNFVLNKNERNVKFWTEWIKFHPEKTEDLNKAIETIRLFVLKNKPELSFTVQNELDKFLQHIQIQEYKKNRNLFIRFSRQVWKAAAVLIAIVGIGAIIYLTTGKIENNAIAFSEKSTSIGQQTEIILSDGSKVWLNSKSKLRYPLAFNDSNRIVYLEGEAFFDVVKNPDKPFIVKTSGLDVKVLGTTFNVSAYPDDNAINTTLVTGSVLIENRSPGKASGEDYFVLKPRQQANYSKDKKEINLKEVDTELFTSWKEGKLSFVDDSFSQVAKKLQRTYNMKFIYDPLKMSHYKLTATFLKNESITEVLDVMKYTDNIEYKIKGDEIYIDLK